MKVRLTNEQVFDIVYALKRDYPDLTKYDKRFNFAVSRTLANIQPIASDLITARNSGVPGYEEFEQKKSEIIKSFAKSVENNAPVFESDEIKQKCQDAVKKLANDNLEVIQERQKEIDIYNEILEQEVEVDIVQCKFEALPDNFNFDILRVLVKESDEELEEML